MFFPHKWNNEEIENCYREAYEEETDNQNRFGGILLPFIGGLLIGGLVVPKYNQPYPQQGPYPYYPPYPQGPVYYQYPPANN